MKNKVRSLIQSGKTDEALKILAQHPELEVSDKNTLAIIEAEYRQLLQEERKGIIGYEEKQIRRNRINDKLLSLLDAPTSPKEQNRKKNRLIYVVAGISLLLIAAIFVMMQSSGTDKLEVTCPDFDAKPKNKILLIPFENVGNDKAKPEKVLRDRIARLTQKNKLSTDIELLSQKLDVTIDNAKNIAENCGANAIIWGQYTSSSDSIRLILNYSFLEQPQWSNEGELLALKDVTGIHSGAMFKSLDNAILSLCSIIAIRQNKQDITHKWMKKMTEKEAVDQGIERVLQEG